MPYLYDSNTKTYKTSDNKPIKVEVGDSKEPSKFLPRVKLMPWDNECNVSFGLIAEEKESTVVESSDGKIIWAAGNKEAHFYELDPGTAGEDGGYELEVHLKEKPASNIINLSLNVPKELVFLYQPAEVTEAEKQEFPEGCSRNSEKFCDSWAVYHASKVNGKYKNGKAFHIYRPHATDAGGNTTWCDLKIDTNKQTATLTVPQEFLDKAVYPVVVDPTFGYTSVGGSSAATGNTYIRGHAYTSGADFGTATSISVYTKGDGAGSIGCAIYDNSYNKLAVDSGNAAISTTAGWRTVNIDYAGSPSTSYKLCFWGSVDYWYVYYDAGAGSGFYKDGNSFETWPATISSPSVGTSRYSIYCTYTAASSSVNIDAVVGEATADGIAPTVTGSANVSGVIGEATSDGLNPTVAGAANVTGVVGESTAEGLAPSVSAGANITAVVGEATAEGLTHTVGGSAEVTGMAGEATADGIDPTVGGSANVNAVAGEATAEGIAPTIGTTIATITLHGSFDRYQTLIGVMGRVESLSGMMNRDYPGLALLSGTMEQNKEIKGTLDRYKPLKGSF